MLPIQLDEQVVDDLFQRAAGRNLRLTVDLEKCEISDGAGLAIPFDVDPFRRHCLLNGLDDIGLTLAHEPKIAAFEKNRGLAAVQ
jgi:3-isopropylmalate/(R)-2-methylmalate dehydratase small subunit